MQRLTRRQILKRMGPYLRPLRGKAVLLAVTAIAAVPVSLLSPQFYRILIDEVIGGGQFSLFPLVAAGYLLTFAVQTGLAALSLYASNRLLNRFVCDLRGELFRRVLHLPLSECESRSTGDLKMRLMDDVDCLGNFVGDQVAGYYSTLLLAAGCVVLTLMIDVRMTLLCLIMVPLVYLINTLIGKGSAKVNEQLRQVNERYFTFEHDSLQYWREVKAGGAEEEFVGRFRHFRRILGKLGMKSIRYWFYSEVFNDFKANYLTKAVVYVIGAFFVMRSQITVGSLILFGEYFGMLFSSLDALGAKRVALRVNQPYYHRVFETMGWEAGEEQAVFLQPLTGGVSVRNLRFSYDGEKAVLGGVDLSIRAGEYVAVVGPSGCGKTTLMKLLLGLYPPSEGAVVYETGEGAVPVAAIGREDLYGAVAAVMQDSHLFNMSIRDNLLLARQSAADADLWQACDRAGLKAFLETLPDGLDTLIGERGVRLSGGQKQRLSIARALLRRPRILLLDEATSAVDRLSEDRINRAIAEAEHDVTVIVVSHKPSAVLRAGRTVVLCDGQVEDCGTHEELMERSAFYRALAEEA